MTAVQGHRQEAAMDRRIATARGSSPGILAIGKVVAAALAVRQVVVAVKHRRELSRLLDWEDEALADIGITRDDLRSALSRPFWCDPTTALAGRAGGSAAEARPEFPAHVHARVRAGLPVQPGVRRRAPFPPHAQHRAIPE
jgi:uncharacterized protein YjiS (DUF1127 family)